MQKILLYYKFVPVRDPDMTMRWQRELCDRLGLRGRIIIAEHGINGTLGGDIEAVKAYVRAMNQTAQFKDIEYKWSDGSRDDFPRLSVKVRPELVTLDADRPFNVYDSGTALRPKAWKQYLQDHPDAILFDARNAYESEIGTFKGAVRPTIDSFKQVKSELAKLPKDQPVLTYCTGDVRCEYLSAYMKDQGFNDVYHLEGGIVKYGQEFGSDEFWQGKCYVFDKREQIAFAADDADIGRCAHCKQPTSRHINCRTAGCNKKVLVCIDCSATVCPEHAPAAA